MMDVNKKELKKQEIRTMFITPALKEKGWEVLKNMREEYYFTDGRVLVAGSQHSVAEGKKADYLLYHNGKPIAVVEASLPDTLLQIQANVVPFGYLSLQLECFCLFSWRKHHSDAADCHDSHGCRLLVRRKIVSQSQYSIKQPSKHDDGKGNCAEEDADELHVHHLLQHGCFGK